MTFKIRRWPILLVGICLVLAPAAFAQFALPVQVLSGGASAMSGTGFGIKGTIGQTAIGLSTGLNFQAKAGFWFEVVEVMSSTDVAAPAPLTPSRYALAQNYPNPFNPATQIRFSLPRASRVAVKVYNLNGALVETLVDTDYSAGEHALTWNAGNYASGTYLVSMTAPGFSEVRKATLLK